MPKSNANFIYFTVFFALVGQKMASNSNDNNNKMKTIFIIIIAIIILYGRKF
jgi:hypothetical protein